MQGSRGERWHCHLKGEVWTGLLERMTAEETTRPPPTKGSKCLECWRQALVLTFFRGGEDQGQAGAGLSLSWAGRGLFCGWRSPLERGAAGVAQTVSAVGMGPA